MAAIQKDLFISIVLIYLNVLSINCTLKSIDNERFSSLDKSSSFSAENIHLSLESDNSGKCPCHYDRSVNHLICLKFENSENVLCAGSSSDSAFELSAVSWLTISGSNFDANFSSFDWLLTNFGNLTKLQLNNNYFTHPHLTADRIYRSPLEELNLSSNNLQSVSKRLMASFPRLKTFNINENNVSSLENNLFRQNPSLKSIHMRDNPWWCNDIEWLLDWLNERRGDVVVLDRARVNCTYLEKNSNFGATTLANLIDECPATCICHMARSMVRVDCRGRGLTAFPRLVPLDTGILYMENNKIDSLRSLINATNYVNLRFVYLENNSIDSISILEWTNIFDGLFALDLSGNSLSQVPTHVIDRLFTQSLDQIKLGRNPWNCECKTVSPFHSLLMKNFDRFKDIDDIRCSSDGPYHPSQRIHHLLTSDFCFINTYVNPLDILNVALVLIIILILAKVIYDYVRLRQTGRIPVGPFNCINYTGYQPTP
ncbi:hypothetical protein CHUAL_003126 [Chamberlinius hualienensis]